MAGGPASHRLFHPSDGCPGARPLATSLARRSPGPGRASQVGDPAEAVWAAGASDRPADRDRGSARRPRHDGFRGAACLCARPRVPGPGRAARLRAPAGRLRSRGTLRARCIQTLGSPCSASRTALRRCASRVAVGDAAADVSRPVRGARGAPARGLRRAWCFRGAGDLWLRGTRTLHEYDGALHRDRPTHVNDLARERRLVTTGWTRRGYTSGDQLSRPQAMLREADAALGRAHDVRRLVPWVSALRESMFTGVGRIRLATRLGMADGRGG
jgi:hypothetical protein